MVVDIDAVRVATFDRLIEEIDLLQDSDNFIDGVLYEADVEDTEDTRRLIIAVLKEIKESLW